MSKRLPKELPIVQWIEAEQSAANLREQLAAVEEKAITLRPEVQQIVDEAAARWLVDAKGQPVDKGIYWFSHIGLVRVNGVVKVIPIETMDEAQAFAFALPPAESVSQEAA